MNALDYIETHHPDACPEAKAWLRSLPAETTPEQAWALCPDPGWMLWLIAENDPTVAQGYACADLAIGWAADALDIAGIPHGLRDIAPITDARAARQAETVAAAAARAAWATDAAASGGGGGASSGEGGGVARAARTWAEAWAAFYAINTGADPVRMADQIRARLTCPYTENDGLDNLIKSE